MSSLLHTGGCHMKAVMVLAGALALGCLLSQSPAGAGDKKKDNDKDKVHQVGDELKLKGKLTEEVKDVTYKVKLEEGKTYILHMGGPGLDAYLYLKDSAGKLLAEDDD